jgi:rubrerythrin
VERRLGRGKLLGSIALGAAAAGAFGRFGSGAAAATSRPSASQDRAILNFALLLEYLSAAFYNEALGNGVLRGEVREFAETAAGHERDHAAFLQRALGSHARPKPAVQFGTATQNARKFVSTAVELEDLSVAAYNGQAGNLTKPALAAAVKIVSVEGRHAAWIRDLAGLEPAPRAADPGADVSAVTNALKRINIR